ncbi:DEAD/DEAH box helicase [Robiginitalea sp. SC105]|uniref:DEAD/DEAH box helicase n=1 Tax=Robiginitalea sp. SC105 TaxID=2762332 RepID=UPI001639B052|nr:DEAD/DEAH box helicase [Robiginitalea sp. SC105]MBC2839474.1 DEAD/DEAH box helicase [Robiginitalea sp. SC105]
MTSFKDLGLSEPLLQGVEALGFETPTDVQQATIPLLLEGETDLVALAQTGTGKTAAFGLPLLEKTDPASRKSQALILAPTRELCLQITAELQSYAKFIKGLSIVSVYGGASIQTQAKALKSGGQIIVATPGRMKDMISRRMADISAIEYCVLDEADEMLNMGFYEDLVDILSHTPADKSTWLFSATMPDPVARIAKDFMDKPKEVTVGTRNKGVASVHHEYYMVTGRDRYPALRRLADANPGLFSVIFCRTKRDTQKVAEKLIEDGYNAGALHGDLSQQQRDLVMNAFRKRQLQLLVATDVAARGIDVDDVTHVIHYQLPDETETYTHRSGRTGRAGKSGVSMVILTRSEQRRIRAIEKIIGRPFEQKKLPGGMEICEIQLYHLANKIRSTEINPSIDAYLPAIEDVLEGLDRDALIRKMVSVEFSRFYDFYSSTRDLNPAAASAEESADKGSTRFFINVGEMDGLDWMQLKDLLKAATGLGKDDIYKVETKDSFSFFNTDASLAPLVMESVNGVQFEGREVRVEISSDPQGSGQRPKGGKKYNKGGFGKKGGYPKKGGFSKKGGYPKKGKGPGGKKKKGGKKSGKRAGFY